MRHPLRRALPLLALLAVAGAPLAAMTLVMPADGVLADQAALIVEATVTASATAPGGAATDSTLRVERLVKGVLPGGDLVLRTPGGEAANGRRLHVWGSPQVPVGSRALLFLVPRRDGTWGALHLAAGVFREQREVGRRLALRDLTEVQVLGSDGEPAAADRARDLDKFARWVGDRAAGVRRQADYFVEGGSAGPGAMIEKFGYLGGTKQRWTEFDGAQDVAWRSHVAGQPGQADGGVQAFKNAIAAWNNDADTNILYRYAGTTANSNGIGPGAGVYDTLNTIIFEDPNDQADGTFTCSSPGNGSGTLAIGGTWTDSSDPVPLKIYNADIVVNDGAGCWFTTVKRAEQVYGHELGHTLGLGHSNVSGALMRATAYPDDRGAALGADDREAIFSLYPAAGAGKPAAPSNLVATAQSASSIRLTWTDNSSNETTFRVDRKIGAGAYALLTTLPANTTSFQALSLNANTLYTFRVRAQNGSGSSAFSNQASAKTLAQSGPPPPPSQLTAIPGQGNAVQLFWHDNSGNESGFRVERSSPVTGWTLLATVAPNTLGLAVTDGVADTPYSFRVRANGAGGAGNSAFSNVANVTTPGAPGAGCTAGPGTLCLGAGGRFRVQADWRAVGVGPGFGDGGAVPLTAESGMFYFFSPDNIELIVKVLDAGPQYWVFYGALSDVEYWVTVTDTATGARKTYHNEQGSLCGFPDVTGFAKSASAAPLRALAIDVDTLGPTAEGAAGPCAPGSLCLLGGRFEVTSSWRIPGGQTGVGTAVPLAGDTSGLFWFFGSGNIELVVKALDGKALTGHYWIFYGALSDVEYDIRVRDTVTGAEKTYHNAQGNFCGDSDTVAFAP